MQDLTGKRENDVPSATKSRQRSPKEYFCNIVRQAARRALAMSTPVSEPVLPRRSANMHSLAPDRNGTVSLNKLQIHAKTVRTLLNFFKRQN